MKKIFLAAVFALVSILNFTSCSKDDELTEYDEYINKYKSDYYVKYKIEAGNSTYFCQFSIGYINSNGEFVHKKYGENTTDFHGQKSYSDEFICGPFKYNDNIVLKISNEQNITYKTLEIYVSKDNSPFSLQKNGNNVKMITYTIDF